MRRKNLEVRDIIYGLGSTVRTSDLCVIVFAGKGYKTGPLVPLLLFIFVLYHTHQITKNSIIMSLLNELGLRRSPRNHHTRARGTTTTGRRRKNNGLTGLLRRKKPANRTAGYRAALTNPNTTHAGREHAKHELHAHGQSAHVPLTKKIERTLGIHQTSHASRKRANARRRRY